MTDASEEEFGLDRLKQFLQDNHDLSAGKFVDALLEELSQWSNLASGREPEDDVTLLAFHLKSSAGPPASKQ
jgi:serine phosphatase RsbU (regulator of sigma subunit)